MTRAATLLTPLVAQVLLAQPSAITLEQPAKPPSNIIGHAHVFADKNQTITLNTPHPQQQKITAHLYRTTGNTLSPVGNPITISPTNKFKTTIRVDFPKSEKPTQYTLVLSTRPRIRLHITAHPKNLLHPLQHLAPPPLQLLNTPPSTTKAFNQLGIPSRVLNDLNGVWGGMLILQNDKDSDLSHLKATRIIIVSPVLTESKEIWVSDKPNQWRITIPRHYLDPEHLKTAAGQANLKRILLSHPR